MAYLIKDHVSHDKAEVDANGFVSVDVILNRVGVMDYIEDEQLVRHYTPAEELEKAAPKYVGLPVLIEHPDDGQLVNPDNINNYNVAGFIKEAHFDGEVTVGKVQILTKEGIEAAQTTHQEVSCGYGNNYDRSPGVWKDDRGIAGDKDKSYEYHVVKRDIVPNHLSLVEKGRAGDIARIYFDEAADYTLLKDSKVSLDSGDFKLNNTQNIKTMEFKDIIVGKEVVKVAVDSAEAVVKMVAEYDAMQDKVAELQAQVDASAAKETAMQASADALKTSLDEAQAKLKEAQEAPKVDMDADAIAKAVNDRFAIWNKIAETNGKVEGFEFDAALPVEEVKRKFLVAKYPDKGFDEKDASYVNAYFDVAMDVAIEMSQSQGKTGLKRGVAAANAQRDAEDACGEYDAMAMGYDFGSNDKKSDYDKFMDAFGYGRDMGMNYDKMIAGRGKYASAPLAYDAAPKSKAFDTKQDEQGVVTFSVKVK